MEVKPGVKTSEFWLSVLMVAICGAVALVPLIQGKADSAHALEVFIGALVALGYGVMRHSAKAPGEIDEPQGGMLPVEPTK